MSGIHILQFLVVVSILIVVGIPLFSKFPPRKLFAPLDPQREEYKHLLVRKEEVLLALKEIEFDFKTDKVSQVDFDALKQKLENEALVILEKIDALEQKLKQKKRSPKTADRA